MSVREARTRDSRAQQTLGPKTNELDFEKRNTDHSVRIEPAFNSMKLAMQIALGIFLAGIMSFAFWMTFIAAGATAVIHNLPTLAQTPRYPARAATTDQLTTPTPTTLHIRAQADCKNYVQMASGEKHCLITTNK